MTRSCFRVLVLLGMSLGAGLAQAQQDHARVAVPLYRPSDVMQGLYREALQPHAAGFATEAKTLPAALAALCQAQGKAAGAAKLEAARAAWVKTLAAWDALATLPLGPLIERRALRTLDFQPVRPELIERAIARRPASLADMQRVGTPAKGLPALEWLLWTRPVAPQSPGCAYAEQVAEELAREAAGLSEAVAAAAGEEWDEERGDAAFSELINQWIGAAERLRWAQIDKPRKEAATRGLRQPAYPRAASGQTAASWAREWQVLRTWAVFGGGVVPQPGQGVVPLETYLRGRGLNPLADRWVAQVERTTASLRGLRPGDSARLDAAVRELAATKALAEAELAPALEISVGFSDADGD